MIGLTSDGDDSPYRHHPTRQTMPRPISSNQTDEQKIEIFHHDEYHEDDVMSIHDIYANNVEGVNEMARQNEILQERNVVRQSLRIHDPRNSENRIDRDRHPHPWHMQMMATRIGRELIRIQNGETTIQSPCIKLQTPDLRLIREYAQTATSGVYLPFPPEPYRTYFTLYHMTYFQTRISEDEDLGIECCKRIGLQSGPMGIQRGWITRHHKQTDGDEAGGSRQFHVVAI
jgi:hypothetical protein